MSENMEWSHSAKTWEGSGDMWWTLEQSQRVQPKEEGSLTRGRFGAHSLPRPESDKEKAPVACSLLFLGKFLAFITWNVTENAAWENHRAVAWQWLSPGLTEELDLLRYISHAYAYSLLLDNPAQISSLLDSRLPNLESNLKNPKNLERMHLGCLLVGFQVL